MRGCRTFYQQLLTGTPHKILLGDKIKQDEMGWACGTCWKIEIHIVFWWRNKKAAWMTEA